MQQNKQSPMGAQLGQALKRKAVSLLATGVGVLAKGSRSHHNFQKSLSTLPQKLLQKERQDHLSFDTARMVQYLSKNYAELYAFLEDFKKEQRMHNPQFQMSHLVVGSSQQPERKSQARYDLYQYLALCLSQNSHNIAHLCGTALARALKIDSKDPKKRGIEGNIENSLTQLLQTVGEVIVEQERNPEIANWQSWESLSESEEWSSEPKSDDNDRKLRDDQVLRQVADLLIQSVARVLNGFGYAVTLVGQSIVSRPEVTDPNQRYIPELIALNQFDEQAFLKNHLKEFSHALDFVSHVLQSTDKNGQRSIASALYLIVKGSFFERLPPERSAEWLINLLQQFQSRGDNDPQKKGRQALLSLLIQQFFPQISNADRKTLQEELQEFFNKSDGINNLLGSVTPTMLHILRKEQNQPYTRTLIAYLIHHNYGYTPEQIQKDRQSYDDYQQELDSISSMPLPRPPAKTHSSETSSLSSGRTTPEALSSSETSFKQRVFQSLSSAGDTLSRWPYRVVGVQRHRSNLDQLKNWGEYVEQRENFADDLANYILSARQLSDETLAQFLGDLQTGDYLSATHHIFGVKSTQDSDYDEKSVEDFIEDHPTAILHFMAKVITQAFPTPQIAQEKSQVQRLRMLAEQEEFLTEHLWALFHEEPELTHYRLRLLTESLADLGKGQHHKDDRQSIQGWVKMLELLPLFSKHLIESQALDSLIYWASSQLWVIPETATSEQRQHEQHLQAHLLRQFVIKAAKLSVPERSNWAKNITLLMGVGGPQTLSKLQALMTESNVSEMGFSLGGAVFEIIESLALNDQKLIVQRLGLSGHALALASMGLKALQYGSIAATVGTGLIQYGAEQLFERFNRFIGGAPYHSRPQSSVNEQSLSQIEEGEGSSYSNSYWAEQLARHEQSYQLLSSPLTSDQVSPLTPRQDREVWPPQPAPVSLIRSSLSNITSKLRRPESP